MIGNAKLTYTNEDLAKLVRNDIIKKFGNRDLACYNLYLPGVITPMAKINSFPDPEVKITSVEDQIKELGVITKPSIPRSDGTVTRDADHIGGENIQFGFDREENILQVSGGPVSWSKAEDLEIVSKDAHWVGVKIGFPLGWSTSKNTIIPYVLNGVPTFLKITQEDLDREAVIICVDAQYTSNVVIINWSQEYAPEKIEINITATLQDSAIKKYPTFPKQPKVEFSYSKENEFTPAVQQTLVDLEVGRE